MASLNEKLDRLFVCVTGALLTFIGVVSVLAVLDGTHITGPFLVSSDYVYDAANAVKTLVLGVVLLIPGVYALFEASKMPK